jgi:hypothetical protein
VTLPPLVFPGLPNVRLPNVKRSNSKGGMSANLHFKNTTQYKTILSSHFAVFCFLLLSLSIVLKVFGKISVSFGLFQILEILDLSMAKDEKVNIAVT